MSTPKCDLNNLDPVEREKELRHNQHWQLICILLILAATAVFLAVFFLAPHTLPAVTVMVGLVAVSISNGYELQGIHHKIQELR